MIQLTAFQGVSDDEFNNDVLQAAIREINSVIKTNANEYRLQFEFESTSLESKLYKNSLTGYYMSRGFKIVNYKQFILIDWSHPNVIVNSLIDDRTITDLNYLGEYFRADDLYLILTANLDMRKISYRIMVHFVKNEIKLMKASGKTESTISLGVPSKMSGANLNKMFAPELLKLNETYQDISFTFLDGALFKIKMYDIPVLYTDIPLEVLFGTSNNFANR